MICTSKKRKRSTDRISYVLDRSHPVHVYKLVHLNTASAISSRIAEHDGISSITCCAGSIPAQSGSNPSVRLELAAGIRHDCKFHYIVNLIIVNIGRLQQHSQQLPTLDRKPSKYLRQPHRLRYDDIQRKHQPSPVQRNRCKR